MERRVLSINPDRGVDFHLRLLGVEDRAEWVIDARDNRTYSGELVYGRPDWVLRRRAGNAARVYDYKNRALGDGDATEYEKLQVIIYSLLVSETIARDGGGNLEVEPYLLYADNHCLKVEYTPEDIDLIGQAAVEAPSALYFLGVVAEPKDRASVTDLARFIVDPQFCNEAYGRTAAQRAGTRAHNLILHSGPGIH